MDWNALTDTFSGIKMNSVEHSEVGNDESANDASESSPPMPDGLIAHLILAYSHPHPNTHNRALALQVFDGQPDRTRVHYTRVVSITDVLSFFEIHVDARHTL